MVTSLSPPPSHDPDSAGTKAMCLGLTVIIDAALTSVFVGGNDLAFDVLKVIGTNQLPLSLVFAAVM
jgi:hypothetical protein